MLFPYENKYLFVMLLVDIQTNFIIILVTTYLPKHSFWELLANNKLIFLNHCNALFTFLVFLCTSTYVQQQ